MKKFIEIVNKYVSPFATKLSRNLWIASLQDAILSTLPLTLVGSVVSVLSILNNYFTWFPDLTPISSFSFGLIGLALAFVFPVFILQRKKMDNKKNLAGIANVGLYLMFTVPIFGENGEWIFQGDNFGSGGMFLAIIAGIFTAFVFILMEKLSFFKNNDTIPDYIVSSFDSFMPILVILLCGYMVVFVAQINFLEVLTTALSPLTNFGQSYLGLLAYILVTTVLYSFGISPWLLYGLFYPIQLAGISENTELVRQGLEAVNINTGEVVQGLVTLGGMGVTLPLAILLLFTKSARLKAIGKVGIIPSIFNINEPIVFGAPIMLNPLMMIPFWINSFLAPTIVYFTLHSGLVAIPDKIFNLWFIPAPIQGYLVTGDFKAIFLVIVVFVVAALVWYPFLQAYDKEEMMLEAERNDG
ncbi:PTS sugar transporter subunit IIC [Isobaculum melis]|uniref:Permease IIC component n=1 Tax=Isobaculum melis TaxID=142588 RepID=A0A1H9Q4Z9_9LACT|nr:PTS transporter subunit EIIC [Isobaculum melis]SER55511.1 PTS system, cellobiose-specific IIC component [Isobaculum melis]